MGLSEDEVKEVSDWLTDVGFPQYIDSFVGNNIGGGEIAFLKDQHLKEIGITKVGHRVKLLLVAAKFRRALKNYNRNVAIVDEFKEWYPLSCLTCWKRQFKITPAAIIVTTPKPTRCGKDVDNIDMSSILDINRIIGCCFTYVEILTKDHHHPRISVRVTHKFGNKLFMAIKNLWEEDQMRIGVRGGVGS